MNHFKEKLGYFLTAARYILRMQSRQAKSVQALQNRPNWPCARGEHTGQYNFECPACAGELWAWKFIPSIREALELTSLSNDGMVEERRIVAVLEKLESHCACELHELARFVQLEINRGSESLNAADLPAIWAIDRILALHGQPFGMRLAPHLQSDVAFAEYVVTHQNTRLRPIRRLIATGLLPF